jgi:hypothetical protein
MFTCPGFALYHKDNAGQSGPEAAEKPLKLDGVLAG